MVKRIVAALFQAAILVMSLVSGPACGTGSGLTPETGAGASIMENVPRQSAAGGCVFLDTAAMREGFQGLYASYRDSFQLLGNYGVDFDDVDRLVSAGLSLFLLEGRFDLDRVREELGIREYVRTGYLGVEVWESDAADYRDWVAFVDGTIVAGCRDNVIGCLEVMVEDGDSLCVHPDAGGVIDRLPGGLDMSVAAMDLDNPLLAQGESLQRIDDDTLRITVVHKYVDEAAAEDGAGQIARDMQGLLSQALREVRVQQEDQFVTLTADVAPDAISACMTSG